MPGTKSYNKGLRFNPSRGFGASQKTLSIPDIQEEGDYTIPALASDYTQKPKDYSTFYHSQHPSTSLDVDNEILMQPIARWNSGLAGLDKGEQELWEKINQNKIVGKSDIWKDRLWRNQEFVNQFGLDTFNAIPDAEARDRLYKSSLTENAIKSKFKDNENLQELLNLTPEGRIELLDSDYQSDTQLKQKDAKNRNKDWWDYDLQERWNSIWENAKEFSGWGVTVGSIVGAALGGTVGSIAGMVGGGQVGATWGALKGAINPSDADDYNALQRKEKNDELLYKISVADNERKKQESKVDIREAQNAYMKAYRSGQITADQIDQLFDNYALSGKRTATDELGNTEEYQYTGSNYYSAFKNTDEFEHFSTLDKLKYLAQTDVLASKYGAGSAMQMLDQDMQNYVSDQQTGLDWGLNTLKNVWVGGVANLGLNITGLGALAARLFYGEEGLANYLKGKDASGSGEDNSTILNPQYWNKVDKYNTFDVEDMENTDENGGISTYNNITRVGEEEDFWSWNTLNEAVRMNKFVWSDLLKNLTLGKVVKGGAKLLGGVETASGTLASESTALSKGFMKVGSAGIVGTSSLGIDAAYGMQTYEEVLNQNNQRLDRLIDKATDAEVEKRVSTPEAQAEFIALVQTENTRRQRRARNGEWNPVDEKQAWDAYVEQVRKQVREEQEALHAEDRQQAENDAANAYAVDATIEAARMATTDGVFRSYLFDKGTLNALRRNNPYVAVTTKNDLFALGKKATRNKALGIMANNVWGGFHSNYFDDVTVGFAEGFGIQDYNNYLLQKYNPAAYGSVMDDYVNPLVAGMSGATNALTEKRSFLDGAIGALGVPFSVSVNPAGIMSHKARMQQAAEAEANAKKAGKPSQGLHWTEIASDFVNNPILQAVSEAKSATRMTENEIFRANNILKDNLYSFDNMVETLSALNQKAASREGNSAMAAEDAKDREAFSLASSLLSLKHSGVVANAKAEPDKANWNRKKKISKGISFYLNQLLGLPLYEATDTPYYRAMQTLEDAASIDEMPTEFSREPSMEEIEKLKRQEALIETFLGLDANKNALEGMSQEEQVAFAKERLKKNAEGLLDVMNRTEKISQNIDKSVTAQMMHPALKDQLMYQYVLDTRWKQRRLGLEEKITGEEIAEDFDNWYNEKQNQPENPLAKYGSLKGFERVKAAQEKRVDDAKKALEKAEQLLKKERPAGMSLKAASELNAFSRLMRNNASETLEKEQAQLKKISGEEASLKQALEGNAVISAQEILHLPAEERARILDAYYRNDYSEAQQAEIEKALNLLVKDGTSLTDALEMVKDAAVLQQRITDNMAAAKKIMKNPAAANQMVQALERNRRNKIVDYFNDKVVAEALADFMNDAEALISEDKAAEKARNYSTAILSGMLRAAERNLKKEGLESNVLLNGIQKVLNERRGRLKEIADFDKYLNKTTKVPHTEVVAPQPIVDTSTGEIVGETPAENVTTDREISDNDRRLIEMALDYAAEKELSFEQAMDATTTEDFRKYVEERNHAYTTNPTDNTIAAVSTLENQVYLPEDSNYVKTLLQDVKDAYDKHQEEVKASKEEKPTTTAPTVTTTAPVQPEVKVPKEEEARPDEKPATDDPFNVKKGTPEGVKPAAPDNSDILEAATTHNQSLSEDLEILLEELDKKNMPEEAKKAIKGYIKDHLSIPYDNIKALQNAIDAEALLYNQAEVPNIDRYIHTMASIDVKKIKDSKKTSSNNTSGNKTQGAATTNLLPTKLIPKIQTVDLDALMHFPMWKEVMESYGVVPFLQKFSEAWKQEAEKWSQDKSQNRVLDSIPIQFVYDPTLAARVKQSMEDAGEEYHPEISAPILMVMEVTPANQHLVEESQLLTIKDKVENKTKKYQVIGLLPGTESSKANESEIVEASKSHSEALRQRINHADSDAHVLRQVAEKNPEKYNGTAFRVKLESISSHTEEDQRMKSDAETPRRDVRELSEENVQGTTETLVQATEEEKASYEEAKKKGLGFLRENPLYKAIRKAFVDRLSKVEEVASKDEVDDPDIIGKPRKALKFAILKGTNDEFKKPVLIKAISQSTDRNTGESIIDLLRGVDTEGTNAAELIASNSRFSRLYKAFYNLSHPKGLFNADGTISNQRQYESSMEELAGHYEKDLSNYLNVGGVSTTAEVVDRGGQKVLRVNVFSSKVEDTETPIATLETFYNGKLSETEFANFVKNLILDAEGNARKNKFFPEYEVVKWQVTYEDANSKHPKAKENLYEIYDDGILEMRVNKLAYPAKTVTVGISGKMNEALHPAVQKQADPKVTLPTETKAAFEAQTEKGKVDADSGIQTGKPKEDTTIPITVLEESQAKVNRMVKDSESREITPDGKHYSILGQIWSRVTSIKSAMEGLIGRFDPTSGWALPSTRIGNSFDEFGRDVLNGVFDSMTEKQRAEAFQNYDNSTAHNYTNLYKSFKSLQARLLADGIVFLKTGDLKTPGKITSKGLLNVTVRNGSQIQTKQVRVAGTIDAIAVDADGNFHLYDFKTHHTETFTKEDAINKGYDRQLSMYAKFLEEEYGIKIKSINILPVRSGYPTPSGMNNGRAISGAQKTYRELRPGSNQLQIKDIHADDSKYVNFTDANFEMEEEFSLDRLSDEQMTVSFEKMTEEEKQAIVEAIQDQSEHPAEEPQSADDVVAGEVVTKPAEKTLTSETLGKDHDFGGNLFGDEVTTNAQKQDTSIVEKDNAINPDNSVQKEVDENKQGCGVNKSQN